MSWSNSQLVSCKANGRMGMDKKEWSLPRGDGVGLLNKEWEDGKYERVLGSKK